MRLGQKLGLGLAEAHRAARTALHLPHEEQPDAEDQEHRQQRSEIAQEAGGTIGFRARSDSDILGLQALQQIVVDHRRIGLEGIVILQICSGQPVTGDHDILHAARIDLTQELRIRNFTRTRLRRSRLEHTEEGDQQKRYDRPQGEIT